MDIFLCCRLQLLHGMLTSVRSNVRSVVDDIQLRFQRLHSILQARYELTISYLFTCIIIRDVTDFESELESNRIQHQHPKSARYLKSDHPGFRFCCFGSTL